MIRTLATGVAVVVMACTVVYMGWSQAAQAQRQPLRQLDWRSVLANDPFVQQGSCATPPATLAGLPCITVALDAPVNVPGLGGPAPVSGVTGYARVEGDSVQYGDLAGDGAEEAVITVDTGTSGGAAGVLIYGQAEPAPQLIAVLPGYNISTTLTDGTLTLRQPFYFGFEPNCCPTANQRQIYSLIDGRLVLSGMTYSIGSRIVSLQEATVAGFYGALQLAIAGRQQGFSGDDQFRKAYAFFDSDARDRYSFADFLSGYADVTSIKATTSPGDSDTTVRVDVVMTRSGAAGEDRPLHLQGWWHITPGGIGYYLVSAELVGA